MNGQGNDLGGRRRLHKRQEKSHLRAAGSSLTPRLARRCRMTSKEVRSTRRRSVRRWPSSFSGAVRPSVGQSLGFDIVVNVRATHTEPQCRRGPDLERLLVRPTGRRESARSGLSAGRRASGRASAAPCLYRPVISRTGWRCRRSPSGVLVQCQFTGEAHLLVERHFGVVARRASRRSERAARRRAGCHCRSVRRRSLRRSRSAAPRPQGVNFWPSNVPTR